MTADGHRQRMQAADREARAWLILAEDRWGVKLWLSAARFLREAADELDRAEAERVALERVERAAGREAE